MANMRSYTVIKRCTRISEKMKYYKVGSKITPKSEKDRKYLGSEGIINLFEKKTEDKKAPETKEGAIEKK